MTTEDSEELTTDAAETESTATDSEGVAGAENQIAAPEFQELENDTNDDQRVATIDHFNNLKVTVSADLGRTELPINDLAKLGPGSVVELDRTIDSPVELVSQGVTLASGEVVVVNGCFAVRITKVHNDSSKSGAA